MEQLIGCTQPKGHLTESVEPTAFCVLPRPSGVLGQVGTHQVKGFLLMAL